MSYTEIIFFGEGGTPTHEVEIKNSYRGASKIWSILEDKYLPKVEYPRMITGGMQEIWDLGDGDRITDVEKICLLSTYDKVIVKKADFQQVIDAFKGFEGTTSLPEQAAHIEKALKDEKVFAVGRHARIRIPCFRNHMDTRQ